MTYIHACALFFLFSKWRRPSNRRRFVLLNMQKCLLSQFNAIFMDILVYPPNNNSTKRWYLQFPETGYLCNGKNTGRLSYSEEAENSLAWSQFEGWGVTWKCPPLYYYYLGCALKAFEISVYKVGYKKLGDVTYFSWNHPHIT